PFWDGAAEERLVIQRCEACGRWQYYPRPFCKTCWSEDVTWAEACGRATLYTYSIVRRNDLPPFDGRVPYVAAIVDLEEGPRMISEVVDCPLEDVTIGMDLVVTYRDLTDSLKLPVFRPV
ncbi:MAG: OB-fold domain-containing protein, partial [Acidimicrobiales bacterium]